MVLITCTILMVHLTVMPVTVELTKHKMQTKYYNTLSFVSNGVFRTKNRPFLNTDIKNMTFFVRQYNVHKIVAKRNILRSHATGHEYSSFSIWRRSFTLLALVLTPVYLTL